MLPALSPFAPAAETWARTMVGSNICTRCAVLLRAARASKKASNTPAQLKRLGRVDGFDEDEAQSKSDEGAVVLVRLLTT